MQVDMKEFKALMLSLQGDDLSPVTLKASVTKVEVTGCFSASTPEGKDAFWRPVAKKKYREMYFQYIVKSYNNRFGKDLRGIDTVSSLLGLERNEFRNCGIILDYGGRCDISSSEDDRRMKALRRAFGYLAAVKEGSFPALNEVKARLVGRGYNSPARGITLLKLAQNTGCYNPGKLNRAIYAAREAAYKKHGYRCSLYVAARAVAIVGVKSPGKAATVARAIGLGLDEPSSYKEARTFVIKVLSARKGNRLIIDGVETHLGGKRTSKGALKCYPDAVWKRGWRYVAGYVFMCGEDSYHTTYGDWKWAIEELKKRRELRKEHLQVEELLGGNCCHLIYMEDSISAGNCRPGTKEFMRKHGLARIASLERVYRIALLGNTLAMNAVKEAIKQIRA